MNDQTTILTVVNTALLALIAIAGAVNTYLQQRTAKVQDKQHAETIATVVAAAVAPNSIIEPNTTKGTNN